jgi:hypothetical protein
MDSFWARQAAKNEQSIDELCTDVTFSNRLRACEECDIDDALGFLLEHYDPHGRDLLSWILAQSDRRFCLRVRASNAIVAFACSVPLWVRLPDFDGAVSLGTLLCITPVLRRTGLMQLFLEWSIAITAKAGFAYRMSTSKTLINMEHKCVIPRFIQNPHCLDKKTYKAFMHETLGGPVTISKKLQDALPYISQEYGVDWTKTALTAPVYTLALMVHGKPVFAALVIDANAASKQVIGYNGPSKHMGLCWAWLATYLKTILVVDAWLMPDDVSKAKPCLKNPKYHVYFHNIHPGALQRMAIPWL